MTELNIDNLALILEPFISLRSDPVDGNLST